MKTVLPIIIAFVSGTIMVISFFATEQTPVIGPVSQDLLIWSSIIGGFSFLLGAISILRVNWRNVALRKPGWGFNLVTVIAVFLTAIPSIAPGRWFGDAAFLFGRGSGSIYDWIFLYIMTPMSQTMFAILAFYIASAAYRAFRARTTEATLLLITASLVMLWRVPMGEAMLRAVDPGIPDIINAYVMGGINLSVQRGIIIGAALGASAMSLRILLGIERTYMGKG